DCTDRTSCHSAQVSTSEDATIENVIAGDRTALDVVDQTFITVPSDSLVTVFVDPHSWQKYWPDLVLQVYTDRGNAGLRWTVRGALIGTMEIWLEPVLDGTILHYFLRADPAGSRSWTSREL